MSITGKHLHALQTWGESMHDAEDYLIMFEVSEVKDEPQFCFDG